jgi:RND family efflux transporter MFP subunit
MKLSCLSACLSTALLLTGCHKPADSESGNGQSSSVAPLPAAVVRAQSVERRLRPEFEEEVGTVRPRLSAVIEAKITGRIEQMLVVPGQVVKSGDLLAQLDAREIQARYDQAAAARQQAESDFKRASDLVAQKTLSQSEFDSAQSKFRVADAVATEAGTMLAYARIVAPFDGVITRKLADVGDLAAPGKPLLQMEDPNALRLEADLPEALIENVALGEKLAVHIAAVPTEIYGTVAELAPAADSNSRTFLVKLDLPKMVGLRSGQFGRVAVPVGQVNSIRIPPAAVVQRGQMEIVFVVVDGRAQLRLVKTGRHASDECEVVSGLDAGETIVTEGAAGLVDGQPVVVQP